MQDIPKEWVEKAAQGDREAFYKIYQQASGYVYALAYRITNRKEPAEEVTQDVFVKIYHHLKFFKFESSFKTWLYRITVNTALNLAKKRSRLAGREVECEDEALAVLGSTETVFERVEAKEAEERLKTLLEKINPDQRACIILREIEGMDYQLIAKSLGINLNTVRSRLKRAREALMALGKKEVACHGV